VGTSSVRRTAQLARQYPHLSFEPCRGNIDTRLKKVDAEGGQYAAIVIAAAGLIRMGWRSRISAFLSSKTVDAEGDAPDQSEVVEAPPAAHGSLGESDKSGPSEGTSSTPNWGMLHAVGQGALALEVRVGDEDIMELIKPLDDSESSLACLAERSLMRTLEGGCSVPIGVETSWGDAPGEVDLTFKAVVVSVDGKHAAAGQLTKRISSVEESDEFGRDMARLLLERGAGPILNNITLDRKLMETQTGNA
jgi:hydroxymethylbilane synthase